jgi:hypothetical protein
LERWRTKGDLMVMKVGDLVNNLNSECGLLGVIVGWHVSTHGRFPLIHWNDGRTSWIIAHRVEVISESR